MVKRPVCLVLVLFMFCIIVVFSVQKRSWTDPVEEGEQSFYCQVSSLAGQGEKRKLIVSDIIFLDKQQTIKKLIVYNGGNVDFSDLKPGQIVLIEGTICNFEEPGNPGQFDERSYYTGFGYPAKVYAASMQIVDGRSKSISTMIQRTKDRLYRNLEQALPQEESGIVAAMILGEKTALDTEVKTLYQQMGISHILAISGLHISLLGAGLFYFLRRFVFPMKIAVWVTAVLLLFYGELTGFSVSATRAIGMMIILLFARFLGKPYDVFCSLALCGLGQLLIFPTQLFQCGFLLSYGTVFGISFFLIPLQKQLKKKRIAQFLLSYLGVQVITLPIVLYYYFEWNPYSILANLLILPLMSMLLFSGIVGAIVYGVSPVAGELLFGTVHFILRWISLLGEILTNLPGADIVTGRPPVMAIVIYYGAVAGIWCWIVYRNEIRVAVFIVAAVVGLLLVRPGTNGMQITNLDVGQGDSTLIRIYGENILIDGGSTTEKEVARYRMVPFLKYMGIKRLDAVVITHGDKDHISGIQEILQDRKHMNLTIERLILPDVEKRDKTYEELLRSAQEQNIACSFWGKGIQWNIKDFSIKVLHPFYDYQWESENDYSMILLTEYQGFRCLFTGDMETGAEACVSGKVGKIDYLKVAHHGSKYTSGETFLKELSPKEAVISYGIKNRYGHPHQETVDRLAKVSQRIWYTGKQGAITTVVKNGKYHTSGFKITE